jgi:hypothetical protein
VFGHSLVPSSEWIKKSQLVIAITGTAGFEAVYFKKPVLSYGKYQVINFLPTVRYTNNFFTTRDSIKELIDFNPEDNIFEVARNALNSALMDVSFSLPGYEKISDSNELQLDLANIAIDKIYAEYPIFREVPTAGTQESVS